MSVGPTSRPNPTPRWALPTVAKRACALRWQTVAGPHACAGPGITKVCAGKEGQLPQELKCVTQLRRQILTKSPTQDLPCNAWNDEWTVCKAQRHEALRQVRRSLLPGIFRSRCLKNQIVCLLAQCSRLLRRRHRGEAT